MRMGYCLRGLRITLVLCTAFLAGVAMGPTAGLMARLSGIALGVNAAFAQDSDRTNAYRLLALFGDVFERVRIEYVDPVSDKDLVENAINGMLTGLDPHSAYMSDGEFHEFQIQTTGKFGGIGIEVTQDNGFIKVIDTIDGTPASRPESRQATSSAR
jgi:carboxyl-terminal processing protease